MDVDGEIGHCGLCAVVGLRDMYVDDYEMIHYQLQKEIMDEESELYRRLIGSDHHFNKVLHTLTGDGIGHAPRERTIGNLFPSMWCTFT